MGSFFGSGRPGTAFSGASSLGGGNAGLAGCGWSLAISCLGGTASTWGYSNGQPLYDSWFIGFAPVQNPKIAVAVSIENIPNGYGGTYAAPIAARVIRTLLAERK